MPKVSINILTKNRVRQLREALGSVAAQSFEDYEVVVVDDGSTDDTEDFLNQILNSQFSILKQFSNHNFKVINHQSSVGITKSRQEALETSKGEYVAILDDDDEWIDADKLLKQVKYLDEHEDVVIVGGGVKIELGSKNYELRMRPEKDGKIRHSMLFRNNFFTSTVMFRREAAIKAGGFIKDEIDLAEDYDLWLRMGKLGKMYNFREAFTRYSKPSYNKEKYKVFLKKQLYLINRHKKDYSWHFLASLILKMRLWLF